MTEIISNKTYFNSTLLQEIVPTEVKIQLIDMVNIAERLEESMVKAGGGMDLAAGTTPRGGGRTRGRGGRGGGRGGNNGGRQTDPSVQKIPLYPPKTPGKKDKIFQGKLNGKCCSCGKAPHGEDGVSNTADDRKKKCPAKDKNCDNCGKLGHLKSMCQTKAQGNTPKAPRQGNAMTQEPKKKWSEEDKRLWHDMEAPQDVHLAAMTLDKPQTYAEAAKGEEERIQWK